MVVVGLIVTVSQVWNLVLSPSPPSRQAHRLSPIHIRIYEESVCVCVCVCNEAERQEGGSPRRVLP